MKPATKLMLIGLACIPGGLFMLAIAIRLGWFWLRSGGLLIPIGFLLILIAWIWQTVATERK